MNQETDPQRCEICGEKAIGFQSLGCCAAVVCEAHAEPALREAKPGELIVCQNCVFQRFESGSPAP
jgi:hypothetical protein